MFLDAVNIHAERANNASDCLLYRNPCTLCDKDEILNFKKVRAETEIAVANVLRGRAQWQPFRSSQ